MDKKTFSGFLFFLDKVKTFLLEIHNRSRHTLGNTPSKVKDAKMAHLL